MRHRNQNGHFSIARGTDIPKIIGTCHQREWVKNHEENIECGDKVEGWETSD